MSDIGSSAYSETDASNNQPPPGGWPSGMFPNQVEGSARANMGAAKRWYNRANPVYTTAGTSTAYTVTSVGTPESAYYTGQLYLFIVNATCGAAPTLNWDSLGAINLRKFTSGAWANLAAGDLQANQIVAARYNGAQFDVLASSFNLTDLVTLAANNTFTGTNDFTGGRLKAPTRPVADNGTDAASTAFVNRMLRSYLAGLGTSNNSGTPNTKINVAAGVCMDGTNVSMLVLSATTLDCSTVGVNGLDAGTLANSTWYHLFVIGKTDGTTALLASTSLSSPAYPTGYTLKRRIASFKTDGSAHIVGYTQIGDHFELNAGVVDASATIGTGASSTLTLASVPSGLNVEAIFNASNVAGLAVVFYIYSPLATTLTSMPANSANQVGMAGTAGNGGAGQYRIMTDTSQHVMAIAANNGSQTLNIFTTGWVDRRGRDD